MAKRMDEFGQRVGQAFHMEAGEVDRFKHRLMRTKTIQSTSAEDELEDGKDNKNKLDRCLTTIDLISLGVGSCCGTGMYVVAGLVAKNVAGPSTVLSFLIAAFASMLSGVCYGEFGVRVPKTSGSAYMYSYVAVGEFVAFLIGWNLILEYMIGSAAGASALSACFDALINHTMSRDLEANVGTVIGKTYPDFLGCAIGIAMTVVLAVGVKKSVRFNNVLNVINFLVWIFIVFAGMFYVDTSNWRDYGFAPYGASGVFSGAATCFYAFIGFDIIATTGEEAKSPSRSIPVAIVVSLCVCLTAYITCSLVLTLMVPYTEIHGDSALIDMFVQNGAPGAKYVVAIGAICALTVSLLGSMFPMPRVIYAMSRDGLLFQFLSEIHPYTGTPLVTTIITGLLASLMALLVGLRILVEMMSIGTLLAYTLVSTSVLILRYQPSLHDIEIPMAHKLDTIDEGPDDLLSPVESESGGILGGTGTSKPKLKDNENLIGADKGQKSYGSLPFGTGLASVESGLAFLSRHFKIWWMRCGFPSDDALPNPSTAKTVIIFAGVLAVFECGTCLLIVFGGHLLARGEPWSVILLLFFLSAVCSCLVVILRQPQNKRTLDFMAPAVPFLPALAIFINMYLMLKLPGLTWARLGVWISIGLLLYFSYSMWHSVKERKKAVKDTDTDKPPGDQIGEGIQDRLPTDGMDPVSSITTAEGYGYDQGGPTNLTGHLPLGGALASSTDASPSEWGTTTTNTNASSPWVPQNQPVSPPQLPVSAAAVGPGTRTAQSGRTLVRRQSSEKPPRPRHPPRRQSTEGSDRPDRPPPPQRQSTESSANSSPWTSEEKGDPWHSDSTAQGSSWQQSESPWQQSESGWQPQPVERSRQSPDPWGRSPNVASNNPFWNAMQ